MPNESQLLTEQDTKTAKRTGTIYESYTFSSNTIIATLVVQVTLAVTAAAPIIA